ncbi:MAG: DUF4149 domain-containing protein [Nitrospinaceae bacterium]|nr:DUF4149 domain-containing protein [Nitrospinaceae bacterium]NIR57624.1 DUF4149 domain-containing protein [Nitrospinaceae bacterium]NIS88098.1 DUF4149 domain-containing protein [Nitrospinaceae bacterium]NIT84962.1 DUF4149 domain-containing protein [Nitrospinaceae bacterium]NIU47134.1 DUF4149 domain-containing protein [Nitrospinaceae bacterium]
MNTLIHFIYLLSLVLWIGSILFFSFFAAPAVFRVLDRPQAGEVVGAIFPKYYAVGYTCSVLTAATLFMSPRGADIPALVFLTIMTACTFYAGMVINPQARSLKQQLKERPENQDALERQFKSLHGWSVRLNATVLIFGLGLLWITAMRLT